MTVPKQKPGQSVQDVTTPPELIEAVERRFGPIVCDLAASDANYRGRGEWITKEENSLAVKWADRFPSGLLWLNPEFADIEPWAEKCSFEANMRTGLIAMLVPGSIGANWWIDHVQGKAFVVAMNGRVKFIGHKQGFPKDLALCVYGIGPGFASWDWGLYYRFMSSYEVSETGCWIWTKTRFDSGYGLIGSKNKNRRAHRVSYEIFRGSIPEGRLVCHGCDTPACVNPRHLHLGTPQSNMDEKVARGRATAVIGNSKLTMEMAEAIREELKGGVTMASLAEKYSVSAATISNVRRGATWVK